MTFLEMAGINPEHINCSTIINSRDKEIQSLTARVKELEEALGKYFSLLQEYGQHKGLCAIDLTAYPKCICGFIEASSWKNYSKALAPVKDEGKELTHPKWNRVVYLCDFEEHRIHDFEHQCPNGNPKPYSLIPSTRRVKDERKL